MAAVQVRKSIPGVVRGAGTTNGVGVAVTDSDQVTALITAGTIADGSHVISFEESDVVGSGYTAIPAGRVFGTAPTIVVGNTLQTFVIDIQTIKSFVRAVITTTGGTSANIIGVYFLSTIGIDLPPVNSPTL